MISKEDKIRNSILESQIKKAERDNISNKMIYYLSRINKYMDIEYDENEKIKFANKKRQIDETFALNRYDLLFETPNKIIKKSTYYLSKVYKWTLSLCGFENKCWVVDNNDEDTGCGCFVLASNDKYEIWIDFENAKNKNQNKNQNRNKNYVTPFLIIKKEKIIDKELQFETFYCTKNGYKFNKYFCPSPTKIDKNEIEEYTVFLGDFNKEFCRVLKLYADHF